MLWHICIYNAQAAYNNTGEIELQDVGVLPTQTSDLSLYAIGTEVAKQFEGDNGELVWFEGIVKKFDEESDLYWIVYSDGDSEDMEADEVRDAVHNYTVHMQQDVSADAAIDATSDSLISTSVGVDVTDTTMLVVDDHPAPVVDTRVANRTSSELAVAMQAMTAAAEQLAAAATRIEAAVHTLRVQQPQQQLQHQQQQQMLISQPWLLQRHWQQAVLQQQHKQQRLAYYQQQQLLY
jgi:CCR4-NOT transcriptional regulation complex NOT5 subunit